MNTMMEPRASGKTHRMLELAITRAARGGKILVYTANQGQAVDLFSRALTMSDACLVTSRRDLSIEFPGTGLIRFKRMEWQRPPNLAEPGKSEVRIMADHFAQESAIKHLIRLLDSWRNVDTGESDAE